MITATRRIILIDNQYWDFFQALMLLLKPLALDNLVYLEGQATFFDNDNNFLKQQSGIVVLTTNDILVLSSLQSFLNANNIIGTNTFAHAVMYGM